MKVNEQEIGLRSDDFGANIGLMSVHVSGILNGLVAQIKVRQVYKNWSNTNSECVYTFPLAWQSVLLGMRVELNGKRLTGMVKPKKTAETEYENAIDSGDLPVMLERASKDLYTANIGNIQPGDEVVIELDFAQILKSEDGAIRFNLPATTAPRYGNAIDAGLGMHQIAQADQQAEHRLFLSLDLSENLSCGTICSPTHEIQIIRNTDRCSVRLEGTAWLDRDFVLVIDRIGDMNFAVGAKDPVHPGEATLITGSVFHPQQPKRNIPASIKVLVDCSGSMQGDSIAQARDCLDWLIGQLSSTDNISLTRFGSTVEHDHPKLQPASSSYKQLLKATIRNIQANLGGTRIEQALQEVISLDTLDGQEADNTVILLITDGAVWDIESSIAAVRGSGHRIYAVGVGSSPAESLLKDMAEVTGGACEMVSPRENMQRAVEQLLIRLRQAQIVEQTVSCSAPLLWRSSSVLHAAPGESLITWHQVKPTQGSDLQIEIGNETQGSPVAYPVTWDDTIELSRIAAAFRLRDIVDDKTRETLAIEYQLVTSETNLILVHERAESEKADELPKLHQVRPMLAAGWGGNGSVRFSKRDSGVQQSRRPSAPGAVYRMGRDTTAFNVGIYENIERPSRMRFGIDKAATSVDDFEIPAFLRKKPDLTQAPKAPPATASLQNNSNEKAPTPQPSPDELITLMRNTSQPGNLIVDLVTSFNQTAMTHVQFRSALAACLRSKQIAYLQWLVSKHMKAAGSAAPIWAVFIRWVSEKFSVQLDRHADRLLREFIKSINSDLQNEIRSELDAMLKNFSK